MSDIDIKSLNTEASPFYLTKAQPCPYLPGRLERKLFTMLNGAKANELNNLLSSCGFRRSQNIAYRPACEGCQACISTRIPVNKFKFSASQRRVMRKNADLSAWNMPCEATSEQYRLFRDYVSERHHDGGMASMSVLDFALMVEETHVDSMIREYRITDTRFRSADYGDEDLIAVSLSDVLNDGISMVYSFYNTEHSNRSLGNYMILDHIRLAQQMELEYLYLGYWVKGSDKMAYKSKFKPLDVLTGGGWGPLET